MGRKHDVVEFQKGIVRRDRFLLIDIDDGAGDFLRLERLDKRGLGRLSLANDLRYVDRCVDVLQE